MWFLLYSQQSPSWRVVGNVASLPMEVSQGNFTDHFSLFFGAQQTFLAARKTCCNLNTRHGFKLQYTDSLYFTACSFPTTVLFAYLTPNWKLRSVFSFIHQPNNFLKSSLSCQTSSGRSISKQDQTAQGDLTVSVKQKSHQRASLKTIKMKKKTPYTYTALSVHFSKPAKLSHCPSTWFSWLC